MKNSPYAECDGKLYVKVKYAGMSWICLLLDRVPMVYFGKSQVAYLDVDEAIKWHEEEIKYTKGQWPRDMLDALIEGKRQFEEEVREAQAPATC